MRRTPLYSNSSRPKAGGTLQPAPATAAALAPAAAPESAAVAAAAKPPGRLSRTVNRHQRLVLLLAGAAIALAAVFGQRALAPAGQRLTQDDIDRAVRHTLEKKPLPSFAVKAYQVIHRSIVHVRGEGEAKNPDEGAPPSSVGTGVVIIDNGVILTNLHVVAGAKRIDA